MTECSAKIVLSAGAPLGFRAVRLRPRPTELSAYRRCMQDAAEIRRRKRRSDRAVVAGLSLIVVALLVSSRELAPALATTLAAIIGFGLLMYGVHVAWLVFYDREPQGPSS